MDRRRRRRSVREGGPVLERNAVIIQRWRDTLAWPRAYPPCWSRLTVINMRLEVCKRIVPWLAADRWSGKKIPIWWTGALTSSSFSPSLYHGFPPCCSSSLRFLHFFFFSFPLPFLVSLQPNRSFLLFSLFFLGGGCEGFDSEDENFWEKNYVTWRVVQFRRVYDFVCNRWSSETIVIRRACGFEAKVHWL